MTGIPSIAGCDQRERRGQAKSPDSAVRGGASLVRRLPFEITLGKGLCQRRVPVGGAPSRPDGQVVEFAHNSAWARRHERVVATVPAIGLNDAEVGALMVFQYWHLAVVVVLAALVVWGLLVSRRRTLLGLAATLLAVSGFALYTLVLDEPYLDHDLNSRLEDGAFIGIPAIIGIGIMLLVKRAGSRRA